VNHSAGTPIDLRSDTVTLPTRKMLQAMASAPLGDDGLEGDPTVKALEAQAACLLGKQAGLFVASGTMGNLVASLVYADQGREALVDAGAHILLSEGGGISRLAGLICTPVPGRGAEMDLDILRTLVRPRAASSERATAMVVVETSHNHSGGRVPSLRYMKELHDLAAAAGIPVHIDGARIFNAAIALGADVASLVALGASVTFCLSKGLSAPMGSILAGSRDFVERARDFRRMVGGRLRQAGCVAAAGIVALDEMIPRMQEDHDHAAALWRLLNQELPALAGSNPPQTNILMLDLKHARRKREAAAWVEELAHRGVLARARDADTLRLVTHRHIGPKDIATAAETLCDCLLS